MAEKTNVTLKVRPDQATSSDINSWDMERHEKGAIVWNTTINAAQMWDGSQWSTNIGSTSIDADEEDIENVSNVLSFKNRNNTNGLGYKYIRTNFDFTNIPSEYNNSIWELRYDFDLGGNDITIPDNVTLYFKGGSLNNYGIISLNNTIIDFDSNYKIFDGSGTFNGQPKSVKGFITPIHFGAIADNTTDCTNAFNAVSSFLGSQNVNFINQGQPSYTFPLDTQDIAIRVPSGMYLIKDSIILRAGQKWYGNRSTTILRFAPITLGTDLIVVDGDINTDYNYTLNVMENVRFIGFTLAGDVNYNGVGNSRNAIYTNNASQLLFEDIYISKFERGISVNIGATPTAAYYNKFKNIQIQNVRQAIFTGVGTAVTDFQDCIFVARAEFLAKFKHLIEINNNTTFVNCSFEGGTPTDECIYAPIGKVTIIGGRDESNSLLRFNGRGITGGVTAIMPNGPTGNSPTRFGTVTDIDDAPLEADINEDQNVLTQNVNFGQGVAQQVNMLRNPNFILGFDNWIEDGTAGYYEFINDRANLMGATSAIKIHKTTGGQYSITSPIKLNAPKFYASVWVKKSSDAIIRAQFGILKARDNATNNYFKEFIKIIQMGDWVLYVASISHYYKDVPDDDPRPYFGLKSNSPDNSWAIFSNIKFWVGGYSIFNGSDTENVLKEFVSSTPPNSGFLKKGDRIYFDGENVSYPITELGAKGVQCSFNLETTIANNVLANDTELELDNSNNVAIGDTIGVWSNNGQMTWTKIIDLVGSTVTLDDPIISNADLGNKIYIFRLINFGESISLPQGLMIFKGDWNPTTNTPLLSDDDTDALGNVYRVSENGTANLGLGLSSDIFNTGSAQGTGNATANYVSGGIDFTSDGTGSTILPRSRYTTLTVGAIYEIDIKSITVNSGTQPLFSFFDGTSYLRDNVSMITEKIEFTAGSSPVFFAVNGGGTFDISIQITLKEIISNFPNTYNKGDIISNDGNNYYKLSSV